MLGLLIRDKLNLEHFCGAPFVLSSCGHCYKEGEHPKLYLSPILTPLGPSRTCRLSHCIPDDSSLVCASSTTIGPDGYGIPTTGTLLWLL